MSICYPPDTDWSCRYSDEELAGMRGDPVNAAKLERAEAFAWSLLAALTAYQIGTCPITVRPCAAGCAPSGSYAPAYAGGRALPIAVIGRPSPFISGGAWYNSCGCSSASECSCGPLSEVELPGPVGSIVSVMIGGREVPPSAYRVDGGNRLTRLDGDLWPTCQDQTLSDEEGFSVTYYRGAAPNIMTRAAAGVLASEFFLACEGDDACRLPRNVTSVTRAGDSYELEPVSMPEGELNIPEVDAVVRIYNPNGIKTPGRVIVPRGVPAPRAPRFPTARRR